MVERYTASHTVDSGSGVVSDENGWLVRHSDYAALSAELETVKGERDDLRLAIAGSDPKYFDPDSLSHGQYIEMAQTTERARAFAVERAEAAEAKLAGGEALLKDCAICGAPHDNDMLSDICRDCEVSAPWQDDSLPHPAPTHNDGSGETAERLGRFNHHPDPAIDFEIEVQSLEARLFDAKGGISKPGTKPETVASVLNDIGRAMEFIVGGDPITVAAKATLREIEKDARAALSHTSGEVTEAMAALAKLRELVTEHGLAAQSKANGQRGYRKFAHIRLDMHKIIDDLEAFLQGAAS